jgi:uncharacterized repeat protein (TIGR01451 family)
MTIISGNIFVTGNADTWQWPIIVTNNSTVSATSVVVTNVFSSGFTTDTFTPSQGSYNVGTHTWTIGTMAPGASVTLLVDCTVTDIMDAPFTVDSSVSSWGTESTPLDNDASSEVQYLCSAFGACFANATIHNIESPGESNPGDMLTYIQGEVLTPSCGDIALVGGECTDIWISMYDCTLSDWTTPTFIVKPTHFSNTLYVDQNVYANDSTAVKGSTTCVYETIQGALNDAADGDTVVVMPGIYELSEPINLDGLNGMLTLHVSPGAFIKGPNADFVIKDDSGYIGKFIITGGGTIQGNYTGGLISMTNTLDPTASLYISNIDLINIEGDGIITEIPTSLSTVNFYDTDISNKCVVSTGPVEFQFRNVFSNVVEDIAGSIFGQAITVDSHLTLNYV